MLLTDINKICKEFIPLTNSVKKQPIYFCIFPFMTPLERIAPTYTNNKYFIILSYLSQPDS
jgi:hypothetical protein